MRTLRHPATIISIIALGVALTGTASAITMINGAQIRNGTITGNKLRNYTIPGLKVANRTLTGAKLANGAVGWTQLSNQVRYGLNYWEFPHNSASIPASSTGSVKASCPGNAYWTIAGGFNITSGSSLAGVSVVRSERDTTGGEGWTVTVLNGSSASVTLSVDATCVY